MPGPPFLTQKQQRCPGGYFQKNGVVMCGTVPETLTLFQTKICDFPYPISDLIKNLIPYFRPEALEPGAWLERMTSCYGTYTVVGVNIKREMVLSPNDEEVANSSKKHTQFKTDQKFRGVLPEKLGGVCSTLPETLTLFQTKICDFPCPISDLIKNLIPYRISDLKPWSPARDRSAWQAVTARTR